MPAREKLHLKNPPATMQAADAEKLKVKACMATQAFDLEEDVNKWLREKGESVDVFDIKFSVRTHRVAEPREEFTHYAWIIYQPHETGAEPLPSKR